MNEMEKKIAVAVLQIKAEPFCVECGGSCFVVFEDLNDKRSSNLWTACTMCGNEMLWTATANHVEMLSRVAALTIQKKGNVIEPYEFVRGADGKCVGLCGGVCPEHWRQDDDPQTDPSPVSDTPDPEPF